MNETIVTFSYPKSLIKEFDHWVILLRPKQITIGSLVIAAKSDATKLGMLNKDVWTEFAIVCKYAEKLLTDTFEAEKFNYLALMMKDPNVHFHMIPRYSQPIKLGNTEYKDPDWPLKTEMKPLELSQAELTKIHEVLKSRQHL